MLSRRLSVVVVVVVVLAFVVVAVAPAFASVPAVLPQHARLLSSAPSDGATVETAEEVVLTFNEDVNPDFVAVRVAGADGDQTDGAPVVDGPTVTQPLVQALPAGAHKVTYRVVSADGHPISGTLSFTTTMVPPSPAPTPTDSPAPTQTVTATADASATPSPGPPDPTASAAPASDSSDGPAPSWAVAALLALVGALVIGALWAGIRGRGTGTQADAAQRAGSGEGDSPSGS